MRQYLIYFTTFAMGERLKAKARCFGDSLDDATAVIQDKLARRGLEITVTYAYEVQP